MVKLAGRTILVAVLIGAIAAPLVAHGGIHRHAIKQSETPPPPLSQPPGRVEKQVFNAEENFTLDPPPEGNPSWSGEEALAQAWSVDGAPGDPKSATVTYGLLTWGPNYKSVPIWLVTYQGTCVPRHGPGDLPCLEIPYNTFIRADTGDYIASWAESDSSQG